MSQEQNVCPICMEELAEGAKPIIAVYDCGHCFHQHCWSGWVASQYGTSRTHPKCVMCNKRSKGWCRLFIDMENLVKSGREEDTGGGDDSSLSSDEGEDEVNSSSPTDNDEEKGEAKDVDEDADKDGSDEANETVVNDLSQEAASDSNADVIVIDDDTDDEKNAQRSASTLERKRKESSGDSSEKKYKRLAKRYKRRSQILFSQQEQHSKDQQVLRSQLLDARKEIESKRTAAKEFDKRALHYERLVEDASIKIARLTRENESLSTQHHKSLAQQQVLEKQLERFRDNYKRDLDRARATSLKEVQQIMEQHPRLVKENHALKEQIRRQQNQGRSSGEPQRTVAVAVQSNNPLKNNKSLLREMGRSKTARASRAESQEEEQQQLRQCLQKSSSAALDVARAMQQGKKPKRDSLELLGGSSLSGKPRKVKDGRGALAAGFKRCKVPPPSRQRDIRNSFNK